MSGIQKDAQIAMVFGGGMVALGVVLSLNIVIAVGVGIFTGACITFFAETFWP